MTDTPDVPLNLAQRLETQPKGDLFDIFLDWVADQGLELYPAQEEAMLEVFADSHVVLNTPTGSGKSLVALAMHFFAFAQKKRSYYTSPIKALVNEKFFALCETFGADNVGMLTGDASINHNAPIICCTQEILAATALSEGKRANIHYAVIDEFHYYADRERGHAWQLPLLTLPQTAFLLMSATLGDTTALQKQLEERTNRPVALVKSDERPVPLTFEYNKDKIVHLCDTLVQLNKAPVYVVNTSQRECAELVQSLMSVNYCSKEDKQHIKEALKGAQFDTPYGNTIRKYLQHGIAIHHGGLIPKYRLLTEKLAQQGLLKIIVGTDTLGVGINMPLRTVVFTKLCKYDGEKVRLYSVRHFKQIAGRAGRKGFDNEGLVIAQAPEHVIENESIQAKVRDNPKKLKKLKLKSPPDRGYVHWDEATFERLYTSDSEPLESRFNIDHSTLLYLLQRPVDGARGYDDLLELIDLSHESDERKLKLREKARMLLESLDHANIIDIEYNMETASGVDIVLSDKLQKDFSIHHSLSLFLVEIISDMDPEHESFHQTVLSFVEAILENPMIVLLRQKDKRRNEVYKELKAQGVEYDELREKLDEVTWPKPDADLILQCFRAFAEQHPWVTGFEPSPKSIVRDMFERWASFNEYINEYGLERSEGVLLRYLNQAYKTLHQNIPDPSKTEALHDVIAYLREVIARADSSLVQEWESMRSGGNLLQHEEVEPEPLDANMKAFRARIHAELMQLIHALSQQNYEEAATLLHQQDDWTPERFETSLEGYLNEHEEIVFNHLARNRKHFRIQRKGPGLYHITQTLCDPEDYNEWYLFGTVDLSKVQNPEDRLFVLHGIEQ